MSEFPLEGPRIPHDSFVATAIHEGSRVPTDQTSQNFWTAEKVEAFNRERLAHEAERRAQEAQLGKALDATFTANAAHVSKGENGEERLRLFMPWSSSSSRGIGIANLDLVRTANEAGQKVTTMRFSKKGAWTNQVQFTDDPESLVRLRQDDKGDGTFSSLSSHPETWVNNLAIASAERPSLPRRIALKLVGKHALTAAMRPQGTAQQ